MTLRGGLVGSSDTTTLCPVFSTVHPTWEVGERGWYASASWLGGVYRAHGGGDAALHISESGQLLLLLC